MKYCTRCLYPANTRPTLILDEEGVCSGCRYQESSRHLEVDWEKRKKMFEDILEHYQTLARKRKASYDCIIPVGGGKDSHYQVWLLKKKYGMNPLLVTFNHSFNSAAGNRNLTNLVEKSGCDHVRYTMGLDAVRKVARYMLEKVGDITWHYHAGIQTVPFQAAVQFNVPLVVWGEHGYAEMFGMVSLQDFVEHTRWKSKEMDMRGFEAHDLLGKNGITEQDIAHFVYPSEADLERVGAKGIYVGNFLHWEAMAHTDTMMKQWDFSPVSYARERTFYQYSKLEDHANDVHDHLKYLKFGYGRGTDDASMEIRHGRMTREQGIEMVRKYDATEPSTLEVYCEFLGLTKEGFYGLIEPLRSKEIWEKRSDGTWVPRDSVDRHPIGDGEEKQRVQPARTRTFDPEYRHLFYNPDNPPEKIGELAMDEPHRNFLVL